MDLPEPSSLQPVGGLLLLAGLFVLRELVSGAMREIGRDLWTRVKERRSGEHAAREVHDGAAGACERATVGRSRAATRSRSRRRGESDG
jgi:hypothetical protein